MPKKDTLKKIFSDIHQSLYQVYEQLNQPKKALFHFKLFHQSIDNFNQEEAKQALKNLEFKKSIEIQKQTTLKALQENQLQQQILDKELALSRIWLIVAFILFITLILLTVVYFLRKNLLQKEQINQELLKIDKMKDDFLSSTSHELLTPINGIVGLSNSINYLDSNLAKDSQKSLKIINACGFRLANLIRNILDMSSLKRNNLSINLQTSDLIKVVSKTVNSIIPLAEENHIALKTHYQNDSIILNIDPYKIEQLIFTLLMNGIKYCHNGKIDLTLSTSDKEAFIDISTSAIDMPQAEIIPLFKLFAEETEEMGFHNTGSGLGLIICRSLIKLHNGHSYLQLNDDLSVSFRIHLPL